MASKTTSSVAARVPNEIKEILDKMLETSGSTARELVIDFANKVSSGEIVVRNGKIILPEPLLEESNIDMSNFIDACENKGVKVQDALNRAAQMVWRS